MKSPIPKPPTTVIRCAIYTRKSTERPALRRLMLDIEAGKIDAVVVYKVDRLSRSLLDFARMMQTFDGHGVSFVSVTQQFNTATSMGRLVLHVLLSFAQFKQEIISERTRDKIAATRRKGKWAGGHPILGYDVDPADFKLLVNPTAASTRTANAPAVSSFSLLRNIVRIAPSASTDTVSDADATTGGTAGAVPVVISAAMPPTPSATPGPAVGRPTASGPPPGGCTVCQQPLRELRVPFARRCRRRSRGRRPSRRSGRGP